MGAIGSDDVMRSELPSARISRELQGHLNAIIGETPELMAPTEVDPELLAPLDEHFLDLGLADVHERREMFASGPGQLDAEELAAAVVGAPGPPLHPALGHPL